MDNSSIGITGTQINYFFICMRKLWLFSKGLEMEHTSDMVYLGKLIGAESYPREQKEILIDDAIRIDFMGSDGVIHETKKSNKLEKAHEFQLLYYLYYLKNKGITGIRGELNYPALKRRKPVELTPQAEQELTETFDRIRAVIRQPAAPAPKRVTYCKTCSYNDLCWVE